MTGVPPDRSADQPGDQQRGEQRGDQRHGGQQRGNHLVDPLDDPLRAALLGPHAPLAVRRGAVLRYPADVSPFTSMPADPGTDDWADAAALVGPGSTTILIGPVHNPPPPWEVVGAFEGVQLVDDGAIGKPDEEAVRLGKPDVPAMLDLVERTRPGPFLPGTIAMGTYLGIRRDDRLVAMAGERLHPPGWVEVSAVCTDEAYRGQGLARRLIGAVVADIRARGDRPMLHASAANTSAIALYERLGFRLRRGVGFVVARAPHNVAG